MKLIFALLTIFMGVLAFGQGEISVFIVGSVSDFETGKNLGGAKVTLYVGGSSVGSYTTASNGKYECEILAGKVYKIEYSKAGYVSKSIQIDLTGIDPEDVQAGNRIPDTKVPIEIFKEKSNVDFSFLKSQPVAEFHYDRGLYQLKYNTKKASQVKKKIDDLLNQAEAKAKDDEAKYSTLIAQGDKLYDEERYEEALVKYEEAISIKPEEAHPNERIVTIEDLLAAMRRKKLEEEQSNAAYNNLITAAQNLLDKGEYDNAIDKYYEASELKPGDDYAQNQIDKIYDLKKKAENKRLYDEAIKLADMYLKQNSSKAALEKYQEASLLDPSQQYPKDQMKALMADVEAQKQALLNKQKYETVIAAADKLFVDKSWLEAKAKYQEALTLIDNDTHANSRLKEIDTILKELEEAKAKEEAYKKLIAEADAALGKKELDAATAKYQEALGIKAEDEYAKAKIVEIEEMKKAAEEAAKQKEIDENFAALIAEGENLQSENKLAEAKAKYVAAKEVKADPLADQKIAAVDALIAQASAEAEKEAQIQSLLKSGNEKLGAKKYNEAIADFDNVLNLDAANEEAKTKKEEAQAALKAQENAAAQAEQIAALKSEGQTALTNKKYQVAIDKYNQVLAIDGTDEEAKSKVEEASSALKAQQEQEAAEKAYQDKIQAADQARDNEKLDEALALYTEAKTMKPSETYPIDEIAKIEAKKKELAAAADQAKIDASYQEKITAASTAKDKEQYDLALILFKEAQELKPTETLPQQEIEAINALLEAQQKDKDAAAVKAAYDAKITEADAVLAQKDYEKAKALYKEAKAIKSDESYPDEQLTKITELEQEASRAQEAVELQANYEAKMKEAYAAKENEQYQTAIDLFKEAIALKGDETEPQNQVNEITALLANQDAAAQQAATDEAYASKIKQADEAFKAKEYQEAITLYSAAQEIKSDEKYPKEQIEKSQQEIAAIEAQNANAAQQEKFNAKFQEGITAKESGDYQMAISKFQEAQAILPEDKSAQKEIDAINKMLTEQNDAEKEAQEAYQEALAKADKLRDEGSFQKAIDAYTTAKELNGSDNYPQEEINKLKAKIAALEAEKGAAEIEKKYQEKFTAANKARDKEQFDLALMLYGEAQELKPNAAEPKAEIKAINDILKARKNAESLEEQKVAYQTKIMEADNAKNSENYQQAITLYEEASALDATQEYPKQQIENVNALIKAKENEQAAAETQKAFQNAMDKANALFDNKEYEASVDAYQEALTIKEDAYAKSQIEKAKAAILAQASDAEQKALNSAINNADVAFKNKEFERAINLYREVLNLDPENQKAKDRIAEAQQIIDNQAAKELANKELTEKYKKAIGKADALYNEGNLSDAKLKYQEALTVKKGDRYAQGRVDEIENTLRDQVAEEKEANYRKLISTADNYFKQENWEKARELYTRANSLNPRDGYPKKQLEAIEAKLNPVVENSGSLESLGKEEDISIEEGARLLLEAERQREQNRRNELSAEVEKTEALPNELATKDAEERQQTLEEAEALQEDLKEDADQAEQRRQEGIELVKQREEDIQNKQAQEKVFADAENLRTQEDIDATKTEVSEAAKAKEKDLQDLTLQFEKEAELAKSQAAMEQAQYEDRTQITYDFIQDELADQAENGDAQAEVIAAQKLLEKVNEQELTQYENSVDQQAILDAKALVAEEQARIAQAESEKEAAAQNQVLERTNTLAENAQEQKAEKDREGELLRQEVISEVDQQKEALAQKQGVDVKNEKQEELNTERFIEGTKNAVVDKAKEQEALHQGKQQLVEDKEDAVERANALKMEEDKRAEAQTTQKLEAQNNQSELNSAKQNENANRINDEVTQAVDMTANASKERSDAAKSSTQSAQTYLDGLENNSAKFNETVANALGEEFPEGVTQQSFVRRDSEGLPVKIVTRRIVVQNGRGDVYMRIQTTYGTSYSKNGAQITSIVWDKETDNGKLVKHF
ncbi:Carboxypeptidase regulatory-like domain-containing protein [Lishizhenia tianjinensis]|uniref:Carboxypeptidase regulatory-like domain-containing protein n=1 Tax=Lishizhenia tianjinensis TaxID=477690 RepID=A0A1I6YKL0_9FLAO|nr:carboxypeptidase regulatory-like domain-containing protein [Lishizhenia tianjinensis]SFT50962.1 Carboxypeptidase regulatory-like domain-containing protein [Lishizhenia tianjinensis]